MNRIFLTIVAASLLAVPLALAHEPAGTPDRFCTGPTLTHDYGAGPGNLIWNYQDGNLQECGYTATFDGTITDLEGNEVADLCDPIRPICDADRTADWDHELEYANGGAVFAARDPASTDCWDIPAHHSEFPTVYAKDVVLGSSVEVAVTSNWAPTGLDAQFPCGDNVVDPCDPTNPAEVPDVTCNPRDQRVRGNGSGTPVPFSAGQDGAYDVFVGPGFGGHVMTAAVPPDSSLVPEGIGATFTRMDPNGPITAVPLGPACDVTVGANQASVVCDARPEAICTNPGLIATSRSGTVTGEAWCQGSTTAAASATGMGGRSHDMVVGMFDFPFTCIAYFPGDATGEVVCDAPDP